MKKIIMLFLSALSTIAVAQHNNHEETQKLTPEQRATLQAKKMALHLDLTQDQETRAAEFFKTHFETQEKIRQNKNSETKNRYQRTLKQLEHQQELQKQMAQILNKQQYATWKERHEKQSQKRHKKRQHQGEHKQHSQKMKKKNAA
ncbi:MAG: hypothetical protein O2914_07395 [Bacteroidetes bacterium]|nr:hypothetical protein [Bacteroidota bacterium]MDA0938640.1 hypothetical protein [Bacteroidota bacterium]MDA1345563.1 hypothetical protein [Bacteroidota bacterium]